MKKVFSIMLLVLLSLSGCQWFADEEVDGPSGGVSTEESTNVSLEIGNGEEDVEEEVTETEDEVDIASDVNFVEYKGAYFSVEYPENFAVEDEQTDYVSLASPDGKVAFAVYSPQWIGAGEMILPQANEIEEDRSEETGIVAESELGPNAAQSLTYITVKADDGSYWRSIAMEMLMKDSSTMKIFSIRYVDQDAYDAYRSQYLRFKDSLQQFAD